MENGNGRADAGLFPADTIPAVRLRAHPSAAGNEVAPCDTHDGDCGASFLWDAPCLAS